MERASIPIACTLEPGAVPDQLAAWRDVLGHATSRTTTDDGAVRVELAPTLDIADVARLAVAEQRCCAFLSFTLTIDGRGTALEVRAPDGAEAVVAELFGPS